VYAFASSLAAALLNGFLSSLREYSALSPNVQTAETRYLATYGAQKR
jgi:hypothetical protein